MPLIDYQKKRSFAKTLEPQGITQGTGKNIFVIHKHSASHLHYDLRLADKDTDGLWVLRSWAVPKEPPLEKGIKRLAVQVEDHPYEYKDFEGEIPAGEYGAGKVEIWDKGDLKITENEKNRLVFNLDGKKLKGEYVLVKFKGRDSKKKNWLFFKV